ncbi:MAG: hypothetical protein OXC11_11040 [Rhodospirillales bacterium]|nr:hypothetical protein [Rhodospirillales bacterium]
MPLVVSTGPVLSGRVTDKVESHLARRMPDGHLVHVATVLNDPALATQMAAAEDMRNALLTVLNSPHTVEEMRKHVAGVLASAGIDASDPNAGYEYKTTHPRVRFICDAAIAHYEMGVDKPGWYTLSETDGEPLQGPFAGHDEAVAQL